MDRSKNLPYLYHQGGRRWELGGLLFDAQVVSVLLRSHQRREVFSMMMGWLKSNCRRCDGRMELGGSVDRSAGQIISSFRMSRQGRPSRVATSVKNDHGEEKLLVSPPSLIPPMLQQKVYATRRGRPTISILSQDHFVQCSNSIRRLSATE